MYAYTTLYYVFFLCMASAYLFPSSFPFLLIVGGIVTQQLFLPKQSSEKEQRLCCNHQESVFGSKYAYKPNNEKWTRQRQRLFLLNYLEMLYDTWWVCCTCVMVCNVSIGGSYMRVWAELRVVGGE